MSRNPIWHNPLGISLRRSPYRGRGNLGLRLLMVAPPGPPNQLVNSLWVTITKLQNLRYVLQQNPIIFGYRCRFLDIVSGDLQTGAAGRLQAEITKLHLSAIYGTVTVSNSTPSINRCGVPDSIDKKYMSNKWLAWVMFAMGIEKVTHVQEVEVIPATLTGVQAA